MARCVALDALKWYIKVPGHSEVPEVAERTSVAMRPQDAQQAIRALGKVLRDQVHLPRSLKAAEQHLEALSLYISSPEHLAQ